MTNALDIAEIRKRWNAAQPEALANARDVKILTTIWLSAEDVPDLLAAVEAVEALCDLADMDREQAMNDYEGAPPPATVQVAMLRKALNIADGAS